MNRTSRPSLAHLLMLSAALLLPACRISSRTTPRTNVTPTPATRGCAAVAGTGTTGLIALSAQRGTFVSLESYAFPGYYVRHAQGRAGISLVDTRQDKEDSTFRIVAGLADDRCISFESRNYPGSYLRQQNSEIFLVAASSDAVVLQDATFCPRPGLADDRELSFEACSYPGSYLNQYEDLLYIDDGSGKEFSEDATFALQTPWAP